MWNLSLTQIPGYWTSYFERPSVQFALLAMQIYSSLVLGIWAAVWSYDLHFYFWSDLSQLLSQASATVEKTLRWLNLDWNYLITRACANCLFLLFSCPSTGSLAAEKTENCPPIFCSYLFPRIALFAINSHHSLDFGIKNLSLRLTDNYFQGSGLCFDVGGLGFSADIPCLCLITSLGSLSCCSLSCG